MFGGHGRAILWLPLAIGAVVAAISLGFALYMVGTAAVAWLIAAALSALAVIVGSMVCRLALPVVLEHARG